ncbi:hypothetical protein FS749_014725 [Ceratobasidium sp. UAMH 11750]|nr:hypothetical protein FS749_014725 [Ceratobasidium sp. UAMH 11750]
MSFSELPKHAIKLYTGVDPLEFSRPTTFNQRLDVLAPVGAGVRLSAQVTGYTLVSGVRLTDLFEDGFVTSSDLQVMTLQDDQDGAWFIDGQRGKLVLKVTKERYESLGIVGELKQGAYSKSEL